MYRVCCFRMVLEPKEDPSTDGIENDGVKRVSYTCNENHHNKEHVNIDMPPANGHLVSIIILSVIRKK